MSIASDIRSYADIAVSQAQAQLNDASGQAGELVGKARENVSSIAGKATEAVHELRGSAEKAVNVDAIRTAVEPYLAQVKGYGTTVADRAEVLVAGLKNDKRVATLVDTAGTLSVVVLETVQERVVKPVQSLTGIGAKPAAKPAPKATVAPTTAATTAPAAKPAAAKPAAAKPAAAKRTATKPTTTKSIARKTPAKGTTKA